MPYVDKASRDRMNEPDGFPSTAGELNYFITNTVRDYLGHNPRYDDLNEVVGVLESAKLELYRRMVAPYETRKCKENGDVYD